MARQVITKLLDDMDGGEADETVEFAMDGIGYTIDLSAKNASKFRDLMSKYQDAGTRTGRVGSPPSLRVASRNGGATLSSENRELNTKIRRWAVDNGYELADRGRIPQYIQDAYNTNTPNPTLAALEAEIEEPEPVKAAPRKRAAKAAFSAAK